jgi:hypothetical protein
LQTRVLRGGADTVSLITSGADGSLSLPVIGGTLKIAQGSNACAGTGATLGVGGTVTVNTSAVVTGDIILFSCTNQAGVVGVISYTIVNGVSFTIASSNTGDLSTFNWVIIKAA